MSGSPYPTKARIREIFTCLAEGNVPSFYAHVADDVEWTVIGSHHLCGHYAGKAAVAAAMAPINAAIERPIKLHVTSIIGGEVESWAVIELVAEAKCKNGMPYNNTYSWSTRWEDDKIVEARAYMDGVLINRIWEENQSKSSSRAQLGDIRFLLDDNTT
ncbi:hypothetical protein F5Y04DRAFT_37551 [Hypomontagnella monticulosa]|nr:hypothetical protein F5Y04DRAFT_37551 [Hypomontagnella monticulosa]